MHFNVYNTNTLCLRVSLIFCPANVDCNDYDYLKNITTDLLK